MTWKAPMPYCPTRQRPRSSPTKFATPGNESLPRLHNAGKNVGTAAGADSAAPAFPADLLRSPLAPIFPGCACSCQRLRRCKHLPRPSCSQRSIFRNALACRIFHAPTCRCVRCLPARRVHPPSTSVHIFVSLGSHLQQSSVNLLQSRRMSPVRLVWLKIMALAFMSVRAGKSQEFFRPHLIRFYFV